MTIPTNALLLLVCLAWTILAQLEPPSFCPASDSQSNPLTASYPNDITGTINGTVSLVGIPWSVARSIVPARFAILRQPCRAVLPGFCNGETADTEDLYPLVLLSVRDHDTQSPRGSLGIPDFSRLLVLYPFVDVLGDGYTSFAYAGAALVEADSLLAIAGFDMYGPPLAQPGSFTPPCQPYDTPRPGIVTRTMEDGTGNVVAASWLAGVTGQSSFTVEAARNLTNQPITGNGILCDNFITLWNSTITTGRYAPVPLMGNVSLAPPLYPSKVTFTAVDALKADLAFVERGSKLCTTLKGYTETGSGD